MKSYVCFANVDLVFDFAVGAADDA